MALLGGVIGAILGGLAEAAGKSAASSGRSSSSGSSGSSYSGGGSSSGASRSSNEPWYGRDPSGNPYKVDPATGRFVYMTDENKKWFPDDYGGSAGWTYGGGQAPTTQVDWNRILEGLLNQPDPRIDEYQRQLEELRRQQIYQPPTLSWQEAQGRAQSQLAPLYEQQLEQTLKAVDEDTIRRGFFGQLPAGVLRGSRAAQVEGAKNQAIANLANQMVGQSEQSALQQQGLAQQRWAAEAQMLQNALNAYQSSKQNKMANIMQLMALLQSQKDSDWEKKYKEEQFDWEKQYKQGQFDWEKDITERKFDWEKQITAQQQAAAAQRAAAAAAKAAKPSDAEIRTQNMATAAQKYIAMLDAGRKPEEIEKLILKDAYNNYMGGINTQELIDLIYLVATGAKKPNTDLDSITEEYIKELSRR